MKTVNQPTMDDLLYVGVWMCESDWNELALTRDPNDYVRLAHDAWESEFKYVVLDNALPVFAFGAKQLGDTALVWGFKTDDGCKSVGTVTKFIRRTMIPALRDAGVRKAVCIVDPDNRASQIWLRHLGFTPRATSRDFGTRQEDVLLFQRDEPDARPH
jgi:hypothetical protein